MGAIAQTLGSVGMKILLQVVGSLATKQFLEWALFWSARKIAAHTETPHDDTFVAKIEEAYNGAGK